ncbi:zinc ribbon domain-containing protein [Metaclostridioides mangenotii]|uniref:zinc ribbon domain-containing protein n=2 Tax=Metaclostridioides mangenotii TaxID=1540 RepID=UPI0004664087|nr:zinc ribbon domain-containing protein [Clostridioides mangenotii]
MNMKFCQSCAMPMNEVDFCGKNKDTSLNEDYCKYCYDNGEFTSDVTMEQMIEICIPHMVSGNSEMTEEEARKMMNGFLPTLKRWNSN